MRRSALLALGLVLTLTGCGPVSPERAARECEDRARSSTALTGQARMGVANGSIETGLDIGIVLSSDSLARRDPGAVYSDCVWQKTGQAPTRPPRL